MYIVPDAADSYITVGTAVAETRFDGGAFVYVDPVTRALLAHFPPSLKQYEPCNMYAEAWP